MKKKTTRTQNDKDTATILRNAGPPPHFPGFRPKEKKVMDEKRKTAMWVLAFQKLGKDFEKHLLVADIIFRTLLNLEINVHGMDREKAIEKVPYTIPLAVEKDSLGSLLVLIGPLIMIAEEYPKLLERVQRIKRKTLRDPLAQKYELQEEFPKTDQKILNKYLKLKPSDIALDHLIKQQGVPLGIKAIWKRLALIKDNKKFVAHLYKIIAKQCGVKLPK